jgi:hypothetical protein
VVTQKVLPQPGWIIAKELMRKRVKIVNELLAEAERATGQ